MKTASRIPRRSRLHKLSIAPILALIAVIAVAALALPANPAEGRSNAPPSQALPKAPQLTQTPELSISAASESVVEGGWAQFTISASPQPTGSLTVHYTVTQAGNFHVEHRQLWIDRNLGQKTVTLTGARAAIVVPTVDDDRLEPDGSVTVTIDASPDYTLSASSSATVTRLDNEVIPYVKIEATATEVDEGAPASFTLETKPPVDLTMTVNYQVIRNGEYVAAGELGERSLTFTGPSATITVPTAHDRAVEPDGSVAVLLLPGKGYGAGRPNAASTTVKNTDTVPRLSVSALAHSYQEGQSAQFTVSANPAPQGSLKVGYRVTGSGDYVASKDLGRKTLTLAGSSATISVPTVNDAEDETGGDGSALVTLLPGSGYTLEGANVAQATIWTEDPRRPSITVSGGPGITEGEDAEYVFSASPAPENSLTVHYTVAQESDKAEARHLGSKTVTLTGSRAVVSVPTVDDDTGEPDDSVSIAIDDGSGYRRGSTATASVLVHDNDGYPTVTLSGAPLSVDEGDSFSLTFLASEPSRSVMDPLYVNFQVEHRGHTATRKALFPWQGTSATANVHINRNGVTEADGTLTVAILPGVGYQAGTPSSVTVTVKETDSATPTIGVSGPASVTEGDSMVFTVTASSAPGDSGVTVKYNVARSRDYADRVASGELGSKTLTLSGASADITVPTTGDDIYDGDASYYVEIKHAGNYKITPGTHYIKVVDDDNHPTITVKTDPVSEYPSVAEGNAAQFTIAANPAPSGDLPINYRVSQSGDVVGSDHLGSRTATLTASAPSATVSIPTLDDGVEEKRRESVVVELRDGRGYTYELYPDGYATYYILDNDQRDKPTISVTGPAEVTEGAAANYTIAASTVPPGGLTVNYRVSQEGGFVEAGELGVQSVQITGAKTTVSIPTAGDSVDEVDGSVSLVLASGSTYRLHATNYRVTTTVKDDDVAIPELRIHRADRSVAEGSDVGFYVFAEPAPVGNLTVKYRVAQSGDVMADADLGDKTLTLSSYGYISYISVPTVDDDADEANGSVTITLLAGDGYTVLATASSSTVTVADDDEPKPVVSIAAGSAITEGGNASFTLTAQPAPAANLDVSVTVSQSGDYGATTGQRTVTIPTAGSVTFTVATANDQADEPDGSVTATLVDGADYKPGTSNTATVTVSDDD